MLDIIFEAADFICPFVNIHIRVDVPGWFTADIVELVNQKRELTKACKRINSDVNYRKLVKCRNKLRKMLRKAKREVVVNSLENFHSNSRKFWKTLNEDLGLKSKSSNDKCLLIKKPDGTFCKGQDLCNFLSEYYASNGRVLAESIPDADPTICADTFPDILTKFTFRFIPLTVIEKYIRKVDITKSSGILGLSTRLLKDALLTLSVELTHIVNESLAQSIFPDAWAQGTVVPIPKGGDTQDPSNWRPITILPLPSKIFERAIHFQLIHYFEENRHLHGNQHGFRKHHSTSTAIFKLSKDLHTAYDLDQSSSCIFVDYRKAFETLNHDLLLEKLSKYGLDRNSLQWVKSYLGNRRHVVRCDDICSDETNVSHGVPQGSILGPTLFIIYVNDLLYMMTKKGQGSIEMYADDTVTNDETNVEHSLLGHLMSLWKMFPFITTWV